MSDDDELGLFLLDEAHNGVDATAHDKWSLARLIGLASSTVGGALHEACATLLGRLRSVLVEQLEQLASFKQKIPIFKFFVFKIKKIKSSTFETRESEREEEAQRSRW